MKRCPSCSLLLPLRDFYPRKDGTGGGYYTNCRECVKAAARESGRVKVRSEEGRKRRAGKLDDIIRRRRGDKG